MRANLMSLAALLLLASCRDHDQPVVPSPDCTVAGCGEFLAVTLTDAPMGPWTVDAVADTMTKRFTCASGARCETANFAGFFPAPLTITVTIGARTARHVVSPTVTLSYPNGPTCSPTCRKQSVTLPAP